MYDAVDLGGYLGTCAARDVGNTCVPTPRAYSLIGMWGMDIVARSSYPTKLHSEPHLN